MNTIKIKKGEDVAIYVDDTQLYFVTDFSASKKRSHYQIKEFLCKEAVCSIETDESYLITVTAYSHLDKKVFLNDGFTLKISDNENVYEYKNCRLNKMYTDVTATKPIKNRFEIMADKMVFGGVA